MSPPLVFVLTQLVGLPLRDVVLTRDEVDGFMAGLSESGSGPTGTTKLATGSKTKRTARSGVRVQAEAQLSP